MLEELGLLANASGGAVRGTHPGVAGAIFMKIGATEQRPFGRTGLTVPPIVFGSSALGNLYRTIPDEEKLAICREWFKHVAPPVMVDTAGKYGAGLALEVFGEALRRLEIGVDEVIISNKLGWKRAPLRGDEPQFEPGVWMGL
jgi:D-threo-aldose 1-dehydrogenase